MNAFYSALANAIVVVEPDLVLVLYGDAPFQQMKAWSEDCP